MHHDIDYRPSFALLTLSLDAGESVRAEAGAMVSYSDGVTVETSANGGILGSLKRSVMGGESFFQNTFSTETGGEVTLAPPLAGDVVEHELHGESLLIQSGSYMASHPDIELDTKFGGGRSFFGGEGLFLLKATGTGPVYLSSYGAIHEVELSEGERYTVDTGHIVAFEETASFDVERVGGLKSTLFSGEGLVCTFTGPGKVWLQTRSQDALLAWLIPKLPSTNSGN
ncbi:TIGR00266 family protein [Salinirubrum litoreum]|uniref:TIGR00266 family protein n=1 Tax=Salinirubrum litoreum TaxID=1126234 RepID=A0ABD5RCR0_9EURY|nr:TIGR00266 family protein [Salinirubrum litoreum]